MQLKLKLEPRQKLSEQPSKFTLTKVKSNVNVLIVALFSIFLNFFKTLTSFLQVLELKKRIQTMESSAEESLITLRAQYEAQIENIRKLRQLYEERAEAASRGHQKEIERERAKNTLLELKLEQFAKDIPIRQQLEEKISELESQLTVHQSQIDSLKEERCSLVAACSNLTSQLSLINNLFSNMLTGDMDFDLLIQMLQDNHNLITDLIANGDINDTAALLVNIAEKVYKKPDSKDGSIAATSAKEEIASNLPKVWRMLIELLSSHEDSHEVPGTSDECYKRVETSTGSRTVISVSQTFLRLKDLILEKNSLVKEVSRLKTLNGHLENRLVLQEKRLGVVASELRKTWGIVSKLKVQHRQLHTHEKILRYELQHKRHTLTHLKQELECCKETWDRVRQKNTQTEHDWELLRKEFALRKSRDASNSAESGYEDDESSQSPDLSSSDLEYDLSPLGDQQKPNDNEDAASDATVIELIDMLELDEDEPFDNADSAHTLSTGNVPDSQISMLNEASDTDNSAGSSEAKFAARAARLRRLEQQCQSLLNQMALTSLRSDTLSTRLEELHEQYGSEERRGGSSKQSEEASVSEPAVEPQDERSDRVQKMEQACMDILDHVTEESPQVNLENICDRRSSSSTVTSESSDSPAPESEGGNGVDGEM